MNYIITILSKVINTLDNVEVKGKENLDALLGCILTLERLKTALTEEVKSNEADHKQAK